MRIAARNKRPPAHTKKTVSRITDMRPTSGCHVGTGSGVAILRSMRSGVNGGTRDMMVAKLPPGSLTTGK